MHSLNLSLRAAHDPDYRASRKDFESFVMTLSDKLMEVDDTIPDLPAKDVVCCASFLVPSSPHSPFFDISLHGCAATVFPSQPAMAMV